MVVDILIEKGTIVTIDMQRRIIKDGAIAIEKKQIIDVGTTEELRQKFKFDKVINAEGKLVMPGPRH